jgi:MYXO-CTERM domain-containing protein
MREPLRGSTRLAVALALLAAASPAAAFIRSTTTNPPDPTQGACLAWTPHQITYAVNAGAFTAPGSCSSAQIATDLINQSIPSWNRATCTNFTFVPDLTPSTLKAIGKDGVNLVVIRKGICSALHAGDPCFNTVGKCAADFNCWEHNGPPDNLSPSTLALTTATFVASTGEILDADMELAGWDGIASIIPPVAATAAAVHGWYNTCSVPGQPPCTAYGQTGCAYIDLGVTVTHEAGHMLGLDHPCAYTNVSGVPSSACVQGAVMDAQYTAGTTTKRQLTQDDVNGVCSIYRPGEASDLKTGCLAPGVQPKSSGGCSSGGGGALSLAGLALGLWRRRRAHRTAVPA